MWYDTESIQPGGVLLDPSTHPASASADPALTGEAAMPETRLEERMTPLSDEGCFVRNSMRRLTGFVAASAG